MKYRQRLSNLTLALPALVAAAMSLPSVAQEPGDSEQNTPQQDAAREALSRQLTSQIEETVVLGRLQSAAGDIVLERMMSESATDIIGTEQISRIGDTNVATALRRVPGVTLVNDKFIYVRGLGERYSSTQLNGAAIPSPDLTRNVIPLDIFPTSIVESLAVQKTFSTDMPITFGGGSVDVRTKSVPNELMFFVEVGTNYNFETTGDGLTTRGGGDDWLGTDDGTRALSSNVETAAVSTYSEGLDLFSISDVVYRQAGGSITRAEALVVAEEINSELALQMDRDLEIAEGSTDPNLSGEIGLGNNWLLDNGVEIGVLGGLSYSNEVSTRDAVDRFYDLPNEVFASTEETTRSVNITGNVGFGLRLNDDNEFRTLSLFIRNSDEDVFRTNEFSRDDQFSDGNGLETNGSRFEERELVVNQIAGTHRWSESTKEMLGIDSDLFSVLDELEFEWYYSDSEATTDIPGEVSYQLRTQVDESGNVLSRTLEMNSSAVDYTYTNLDDTVESYGYDVKLPIFMDDFTVDVSAGWDYVRKARQYRQLDFGLGTANNGADVLGLLDGGVNNFFSDENILNPDLDILLSVNDQNQRSYLAAITNASAYAKVDLNWQETWRFIAGVRAEDYKQFGIPWTPLEDEPISTDPVELEAATFVQDEVYPSLSIVYMTPDFFAETYQLRLNFAETVVRPDLREITPTSYRDPLNQSLVVEGNSDVIPSEISNIDLRSEWFFSNGDNFTVSLFYKDIKDPIEYIISPTSDAGFSAKIFNTDSAEIYGVEFEWLKDLSTFGDAFAPFYLQGNVTLADSELTVGESDDFSGVTNDVRPLTGASDYVVNLQLGFDSDDGKHAATLVYNVFGERLRGAGTLPDPDSYEQPFNSLDLTYSYYPTYNTILKLKLKNLLDESEIWEQGGVEVFEQEVGTSASLDFQWQF